MFSENVDCWTPCLHSPSALLQLTSNPPPPKKKSLNTRLEPVFLQPPPRGHLQITSLWWSVRITLMVPQDQIYLHTLKAAA